MPSDSNSANSATQIDTSDSHYFYETNSNDQNPAARNIQEMSPFSHHVHMSTKLASNCGNSNTNSPIAPECNQNMKVQMNPQSPHPCIYTPPPSRPLSTMNLNQPSSSLSYPSQAYMNATQSPTSALYSMDLYHGGNNSAPSHHLQHHGNSTGDTQNVQAIQARPDLQGNLACSSVPSMYSENMISNQPHPGDMYHVQYGSYDYNGGQPLEDFNNSTMYGMGDGNAGNTYPGSVPLTREFANSTSSSSREEYHHSSKSDTKSHLSVSDQGNLGSSAVSDSGLGEYKCNDCNKVFTRICYLKQHNKSFHNGEKPYKCAQCGKRFPVEMLYQEHLAKHAGDKPYKCDVCPKQFNHKTDLRRHMCLHTGEKPFSCDVCGKGFIREDRMIKHSDTHKKKQPLIIQ
eukprot:maker-scaffold627_size122700-snap-gene-0.38 protein:Tk10655 transcript:maker-scaffold627_size122700-snap-gene-0.38-mRNA-1 annotation:"zinc finger protein 347-like"